MNTNWKNARRELKGLGIHINTSYSACCLGCIPEEKIKHPKEAPAIYQLAKRWNGELGGYLCHSNITPLADSIVEIFERNGIKYEWDKSQARSIFLQFPEEGI